MTALQTLEGIYRNGKVELTTIPYGVPEATPVLVTFLEAKSVSLRERGIEEAQAADLRARLATFAEDWDSPAMDIYDDPVVMTDNLATILESAIDRSIGALPMAEIDSALRHT
jgi:hypothetical protein